MPRHCTLLPTLVTLIALYPGASPRANAQVAFAPGVSAFQNGVMLNATPVVSYDRRYVRLGMNPVFTGLEGFTTVAVPGAVGGGGINGRVPGFPSVGIPGQTFDVGMDGLATQSPYPMANPYASPGATAMLSGGYRPGPVNLGIEPIAQPRPKASKPLSRRARIIRSRR